MSGPDPAWPPPRPESARPAPPPGWGPPPGPPAPGGPPAPAPGYPAPPTSGRPGPALERPVEYHTLLAAGPRSPLLGLVGVPLQLLLTFVLAPVAMIVPFVVWYAATGQPVGERVGDLVDLTDPTPASLAYLNLTLAAAIPITWFLVRVLHGMAPRWLTSVRPRMRWGYFFACLGLSLVALVATLLVAAVLPQQGAPGEVTGELNDFTRRTRDFLLVVLLLTPLQAAGEEYAFRGYLTQVVGSIGDSAAGRTVGRVLAVIVPALLFALAHGVGQSPPIFFDRLAFGLVAGVLVLVTGGLEAAIAMHVLNNFVAFGLALALGDIGSSLNPTGGSWWTIPTTLVQSLVYLGLAWPVARLMRVRASADPGVLAASTGLVYRFPPARTE